MSRLESYHDLCKEIELWEIRLWDLESERRILLKRMMSPPQTKLCANYSGLPGAGARIIDLPRAWGQMQSLDERIAECKDVLSLKKEAKRRMEKVMSEFDSLEYKVAYMRDVEKKPLYVIAEELGYTYGWIRQVSHRTRRRKEKIPS